jgi:hypothetical protein
MVAPPLRALGNKSPYPNHFQKRLLFLERFWGAIETLTASAIRPNTNFDDRSCLRQPAGGTKGSTRPRRDHDLIAPKAGYPPGEPSGGQRSILLSALNPLD